jgi:three-Cys-motif partner protein
MDDPHFKREQTRTKHFILKSYLQTLVYKLFQGGQRSLTYVDGFSGPWEAKTENFSDTSFMIAIDVLRTAHFKMLADGIPRTTKCFFVEKHPNSHALLASAVLQFHSPESGFHIKTFKGEFESATSEIIKLGTSFALVFIDPTGWTGYTYDLIGPVLKHTPGEVLINFMYDFVNRAVAMDDPKTVASLDAILGGPGWKQRLIHDLPLGQEIERTFREVLKKAGTFEYVLSTRIDKSTADRQHFFIAYGTRKAAGRKAFRQVEFDALRGHKKLRVRAKQLNRETRTGQNELFGPDFESNATFQSVVDQTFDTAKNWTLAFLQDRGSPIQFGVLLINIMEQFMLRETNVKDLCVELANEGRILNTWRVSGKLKPVDSSRIELGAAHY